jgi:hypothetical protein
MRVVFRSRSSRFEETRFRHVYERDLVLVRPDLHVVWRGDRPPDDSGRLAAVAAGFGDTQSLNMRIGVKTGVLSRPKRP